MTDIKFGFYRNQWMIGLMVDYGRIIPTRWLVFLFGPITVSIAIGSQRR